MKTQDPIDGIQNDENDGALSKTKRKAMMEELQDLGVSLVQLSANQLAKFDLPDRLFNAIVLARKVTANGALRRQYQFIGKLMRSTDVESIKEKLAEINNDSPKSTRILHFIESWRERLLAKDEDLSLFVAECPECDVTELRTLIRATRKELMGLERRNYRKLFQLIREVIVVEEKPE